MLRAEAVGVVYVCVMSIPPAAVTMKSPGNDIKQTSPSNDNYFITYSCFKCCKFLCCDVLSFCLVWREYKRLCQLCVSEVCLLASLVGLCIRQPLRVLNAGDMRHTLTLHAPCDNRRSELAIMHPLFSQHNQDSAY